MEHIGLFELIKYLEYGTNLHIGVFFLEKNQSQKFDLPYAKKIHSAKICSVIKQTPKDYDRCFRCRNYSLAKAIRNKHPFASLCINGVYEYTKPVLIDNKVVAVIFIGNILTEEGKQKLKRNTYLHRLPLESMEKNFDYQACDELGRIISSYIVMLMETYPPCDTQQNPIIKNIKTYLLSNLEYDLKSSDVSAIFHYNEVYIGRLFKEQTGKTIKEYLTEERIKLAKKLLKSQVNVTETAIKTGFNSLSYFNRIFKKFTGLTPNEYKNTFIATE